MFGYWLWFGVTYLEEATVAIFFQNESINLNLV